MTDLAEKANAKSAKQYLKQTKIGEGTYAVVYKGREVATGREVAIKKIKVGDFKDGLDMSAIREIKFLRELKHPNIVEMIAVFSSKQNLNLVLEFLDTDLEYLIRNKSLVFLPGDVKSWLEMTLRGVEFCHRNGILHRDLKPNNLLIAHSGEVKLADFGLARQFSDGSALSKMTCAVVTRWYRSPELLFGARQYSSSVDMWSVGCIFAELMLRVPFFAGETDLDQLKKIWQALGSPVDTEWPGHKQLPDYVPLPFVPKQPWHLHFSAATEDAVKLLKAFLSYDPLKRPSAKEALDNRYFNTAPFSTHPSKLPKSATGHVLRVLAPELEGPQPPPSKKRKTTADGDERRVARKLVF